MNIDWSPLREEFKKWRRHDLTLPIWWRDDDAVRPTPALEKLYALSEEVQVPIHLAVIPREATPALADYVADRALLIPVVHGWAHKNHQPKGENRCEFGEARPIEDRRFEAAEGLQRLRNLFGDQVKPMFVPPWNRLPESFYPDLAEVGYASVSTCRPRPQKMAAEGLVHLNSHIDPIYWGPAKRLEHPELIVQRMVHFIKQRRQGKHDNTEPFGLLTHHLAHTDKTWTFCQQYWAEVMDGPVQVFHHS